MTQKQTQNQIVNVIVGKTEAHKRKYVQKATKDQDNSEENNPSLTAYNPNEKPYDDRTFSPNIQPFYQPQDGESKLLSNLLLQKLIDKSNHDAVQPIVIPNTPSTPRTYPSFVQSEPPRRIKEEDIKEEEIKRDEGLLSRAHVSDPFSPQGIAKRMLQLPADQQVEQNLPKVTISKTTFNPSATKVIGSRGFLVDSHRSDMAKARESSRKELRLQAAKVPIKLERMF